MVEVVFPARENCTSHHWIVWFIWDNMFVDKSFGLTEVKQDLENTVV